MQDRGKINATQLMLQLVHVAVYRNAQHTQVTQDFLLRANPDRAIGSYGERPQDAHVEIREHVIDPDAEEWLAALYGDVRVKTRADSG
jgi:hypothetical protein